MNRLYYGNNLRWLPEIPAESVDLIYLDPPFNSKRAYNAIFRGADGKESAAQVQAFTDYWEWNQAVEKAYGELISGGVPGRRVPEKLITFIEAVRRLLGDNNMAAYLVMMAARIAEMRRLLKPTGSLYLHCDPTASHYLKLMLDAIFGSDNFRNELVWERSGAKNDPRRFGRSHDVILFYSSGSSFTWNTQFTKFEDYSVAKNYTAVEPETGRRFRLSDLTANKAGGDTDYEWRGMKPYKGRHWAFSKENMERFERDGRLVYRRTGMPVYKRYLDEMPGVPLQDVWTDIRLSSSDKERIGYPTQKPITLLERIIQASSNAGDVVLDPFCGCGTAIEAAEKLGRSWIGIDITYLAVPIIRRRLKPYSNVSYAVDGLPEDLESAMALAEGDDKYQYQWWSVDHLGGTPVGAVIPFGREGKKGSDKGIDGIIRFKEHPQDDRSQRIIISVKAGKALNPAMVRELRGTIEREKSPIGVFVSAYEPSSQMRSEAAAAGTYRPVGSKRAYPRIQLISAADIFNGKVVEFPGQNVTEDEASATTQLSLFDESAKRKGPKRAPAPAVPDEVEGEDDSMSS